MIHDVVPTTSYLTPLDSFNVFDLDGGGDISWVEFKVRGRKLSDDATFGDDIRCKAAFALKPCRMSLRTSEKDPARSDLGCLLNSEGEA